MEIKLNMPTLNNALQMGINTELLKKLMKDKNLTPALMHDLTGVQEQTGS